jgi:hypothetical protein
MAKTQEDIDNALNEDMAAFSRDPTTWAFREYWQAHDLRFVELTDLIDHVVTGKTIVSNEVMMQCRQAMLQINQINHVLTELSKSAGQTNLVSAMNIAYAYDARAIAARSKLHIIESWLADVPLQLTALR